MSEMDRPDGLGVLWIAAGAALTLLFVVVMVLVVLGKSALLGLAVGPGSDAARVIAGVLTVALLAAGVARWRGVRKVRMWMLTVLAGMTCGAWIVVIASGGGGV
jgi:hypothetical protein